ncbi:DUF3000 domain-containing protein [Streptomyces sp. A7024]|uniref:DUF3000 domain-containing protein n=1 Tax=Streptomyces coryli TaxID=1128680 RepID=A0A6G4U6L6_9ACTN|nr:DUF3000 domain-containing protein [Streptomyces coryli]NGN67885.1 DUF3000 domain-containing protein [Streptomyces coryli]
MAAASGHLADGTMDFPEGEGEGTSDTPPAFRQGIEALRTARVRPEVQLEPIRAPRRLAPYAYALEALVEDADEELADGRLVLLHDPDGHEAWQGHFRMVTIVRAELEAEMAADPLLPEVCWSWLTGALDLRGAAYGEPSGTVTRAASHYFGGMADHEPSTKIEIRASWTPRESPTAPGMAADFAAHLAAWCELLCQCAGLPPAPAESLAEAGVVTLPQRRRGPQSSR